MADHVLHVATTVATLTGALATLYVDIRYHTGWQRGGYMMTYTHWALALMLVFQTVSLLDAVTAGAIPLLSAPRRWLLLLNLATAFNVDCAYFIAVVPPRLMGADKLDHGPFMTSTSWHTHCLNVMWLLADAATHVPRGALPVGVQVAEFLVFGVAAPVALSAAYYWFAMTIKDKRRGEHLLARLNVPLPRDGDGWHVLDVRERGNIEAVPGDWVYPAMSSVLIRFLFVGATFLFMLLATGSLYFATRIAARQPPLKVLMTAFVAGITPYLYLEDLTADGTTPAALLRELLSDLRKLRVWVYTTALELSDAWEQFDGVSFWADLFGAALETGQMYRADTVELLAPLLAPAREAVAKALSALPPLPRLAWPSSGGRDSNRKSRSRASARRRTGDRSSKKRGDQAAATTKAKDKDQAKTARGDRVATDEAEVPLDFDY